MDKETIEAKIRNALSPTLVLIDLLDDNSYTAEQKIILMKEFNMTNDVRKHCDRLISIGKLADNLIEEKNGKGPISAI